MDGIDPTDYLEAPEFDTDSIAVWGVVSGNRSHWEQMQPGDVVLFHTKTKVYTHMATVVQKQANEALATKIWTTYDEGRRVADLDEPWPFVFYLENVQEVNIPSPALHADIGWSTFYPQSFTRVIDERRARLIEQYGSIAACLRYHRRESAVADPEALEETTADLLAAESEPPLTEPQATTTQSRLVRSRAFRDAVRAAYENTCAFCGAQRETIAGTPEVEAAHIYPKSEGGVDAVRNGLALCRFHHWAFDSGWATVTDDLRVRIRERPGQETYDDLVGLDGDRLTLPAESAHHPGQKFLQAHREFYGFE